MNFSRLVNFTRPVKLGSLLRSSFREGLQILKVLKSASVWIAPLEIDSPALGVSVGAAYKGPLIGRFEGQFKGRIRPSEGSDGRNAEL